MGVIDNDRRTIHDALDVISGKTDNHIRTYARGAIRYDIGSREVYSYGTHFPLVRYIPARGNIPALWLLNGDAVRSVGRGRWGNRSRTPDHQDIVRRYCADSGLATFILPRTALEGAGILPDTVRPLEVREDRWEPLHNEAHIPARSHFDTPLPTRESIEAREIAEIEERRGRNQWYDADRILAEKVYAIHETQTLATKVTVEVVTTAQDSGLVTRSTITGELTRTICYRGHRYVNGGRSEWKDYDPPEVVHYLARHIKLEPGSFRPCETHPECWIAEWASTQHHLGDSLFTARREPRRVICKHCHGTGEVLGEQLTTDGAPDMDKCLKCHGSGRATINRGRQRFVSSFDYQERMPLYFLAALPSHSRAVTVEDAIEDLAPPAVHAAIARGLDVRRQGDVFAIQTNLTDTDIAARAIGRARMFTATNVRGKPRKGETGYRHETPKARRIRLDRFHAMRRTEFHRTMAQYLAENHRQLKASRDYRVWNEAGGGYLTDGNRARAAWARATSIADARYGAAWIAPDYAAIRRVLAIFGTAHTATEVVTCKGGVTYVRGTMHHRPDIVGERRRPDHSAVQLGDGSHWYVCVRNTVPKQ